MKYALCLLLPLSVILGGCASSKPKDRVSKSGEISREWTEQGITDNYIFATGIGAADQTMESKTQKMATSRNAAVVGAQYNMLSVLKGVKLEGGITVEQAMETDSLLATKIDAEIKGAEIAKSEWTADDGCVVTLRLPKKRLKMIGLKVKDFK
ncbi:MAG: hypothetical protein JW871_01240 [Endomicrobiales bacterium]|nr:hypothetical protein [Endomicrobiales bacterium]